MFYFQYWYSINWMKLSTIIIQLSFFCVLQLRQACNTSHLTIDGIALITSYHTTMNMNFHGPVVFPFSRKILPLRYIMTPIAITLHLLTFISFEELCFILCFLRTLQIFVRSMMKRLETSRRTKWHRVTAILPRVTISLQTGPLVSIALICTI